MCTHLPLYKSFSCVKGQYYDDILTNDGYCVGLLVQREARLNSEKML